MAAEWHGVVAVSRCVFLSLDLIILEELRRPQTPQVLRKSRSRFRTLCSDLSLAEEKQAERLCNRLGADELDALCDTIEAKQVHACVHASVHAGWWASGSIVRSVARWVDSLEGWNGKIGG